MYLKPNELRLHDLTSVVPGTILRIVGRSDIGCAVKLDGTPYRILILGGSFTYHDVDWRQGEQAVSVVCPPERVVFELDDPNESAAISTSAAIVRYAGGAYLNARLEDRYKSSKIDLSSWDSVRADLKVSACMIHTDWKVGYLDDRRAFVPLFDSKKANAVAEG